MSSIVVGGFGTRNRRANSEASGVAIARMPRWYRGHSSDGSVACSVLLRALHPLPFEEQQQHLVGNRIRAVAPQPLARARLQRMLCGNCRIAGGFGRVNRLHSRLFANPSRSFIPSGCRAHPQPRTRPWGEKCVLVVPAASGRRGRSKPACVTPKSEALSETQAARDDGALSGALGSLPVRQTRLPCGPSLDRPVGAEAPRTTQLA
jgi:hypothetical protein